MFTTISWMGFYYCGYKPETGSLWCRDQQGCFWMEDYQLATHLKVLTVLESINEKELTMERL